MMQTTTLRGGSELTFQLGQEYVTRISSEKGIPTKLLYHSHSTSTCKDKLKLLQDKFPKDDWDLGRIVKTLFAAVDDDWVGFVMPERGKKFKLSGELAEEVYKKSDLKTVEKEYWLSKGPLYIPKGMEPGTCTPFVPKESMMKTVDHIFICDVPKLEKKVVDISIGGMGQDAHRTSMHLPYGAIFDILKHQFPDKIHKVRY
jgi:uncharacterized phage-associated protein